MMPGKTQNPSRVRGRVVSRSMFPAAMLVAALTLAVGALACGSGGNEGDTEPASTSGEHTEAKLYTCAMHPHIVLKEPGDCPICGMELVPVATGASEVSDAALQLSPYAQALARVQTARVERRPVTIELRLAGKLVYDETRVRTISAWLPGRIDRLYVDYVGVTVNVGDHLGELYGPDLLSSQQDLIEAARSVRRSEQSSSSLASITRATLEASRERFRLWGFSPKQIRRLEQQRQPSDHLTLYSPISGVVIERAVDEGSYVREGDTILRIADLSELWLVLAAYESDLAWLLVGQAVEFELPALPGERFEGRIAFVSPVVDPKTRTTQVRLNVANTEGRLKPEMFAKARVRVHVRDDGKVVEPSLVGKWIGPMHPEIVRDRAGTCPICGMKLVASKTLGHEAPGRPPLVIPITAVLITGTRAIVYVSTSKSDGNTTYEAREVLLGPRASDSYIVLDGLHEGESVVVQAAFKIDASSQIQAKRSMMNPVDGMATTDPHAHMHMAP